MPQTAGQLLTTVNRDVIFWNTFVGSTRSQWESNDRLSSQIAPLVTSVNQTGAALLREITVIAADPNGVTSALEAKVVAFTAYVGQTVDQIKQILVNASRTGGGTRPGGGTSTSTSTGTSTGTSAADAERARLELEALMAQQQSGGTSTGGGGGGLWLIVAGVALGAIAISAARSGR